MPGTGVILQIKDMSFIEKNKGCALKVATGGTFFKINKQVIQLVKGMSLRLLYLNFLRK